MKTIVIYHEPQECGDPFFLILNAETGKEVQTIVLPSPSEYICSGIRYEEIKIPTGVIKERFTDTTVLPEIGDCITLCKKNTRLVLRSITDITEDFNFMHTYRATLHYEEVKIVRGLRYLSKEEDCYRKDMEELGFDMSNWCIYKRRKTDYHEFLRSLFPDCLNMIFI